MTFNLQGKGFFRLVFHCGAKVTDNANKQPLFEDTSGLLDWVSGNRAIVKFKSMDDIELNKENLKQVILKWIELYLAK